jgi:RNA polymerase sigma factor (sigma-70 family)
VIWWRLDRGQHGCFAFLRSLRILLESVSLLLHGCAMKGHDALIGDGLGRGERSPPAAERGLDVWFAGAQRGDPAALDGLLRAVFPAAQRFAAHSCTSREDAEDVVQDALTVLVRRVGALRAAETVTSWLFVTIRNACLRRMAGVILVPLDAVPEVARSDFADGVVDRVVVADALAALPAPQRDVIVLVDLLGLSAERTAQRLGIGVRAARSRLHRGRRALAASIGKPEARRSA